VASAAMQALRRLTATTSSRDPTLMVKEWEPRRRTAWGRRRAAEGVEPGRPDGPRQGVAESSLAGSSLGSSVLEMCLGKEGAEQKTIRLECDTHKNVTANRVKLCNEQREN
jgi:hypothetical protein